MPEYYNSVVNKMLPAALLLHLLILWDRGDLLQHNAGGVIISSASPGYNTQFLLRGYGVIYEVLKDCLFKQ